MHPPLPPQPPPKVNATYTMEKKMGKSVRNKLMFQLYTSQTQTQTRTHMQRHIHDRDISIEHTHTLSHTLSLRVM